MKNNNKNRDFYDAGEETQYFEPVKRRSTKKGSKTEIIVIVLFALVALVAGLFFVASNVTPPDVSNNEIPFDHTIAQTGEVGGSDNTVTPGKNEYIRREGVYNFLLVGYDKLAHLTDVIMIAQYDVNRGAVNIVQFPRDTFARYNEKKSAYHKMNGALSYYKWDLEKLTAFLETNLCIDIDYYASIDLQAFVNIVDAIGGVELNVPADMEYDDPAQNLYINLKKGYQTLDGKKAEQFVRFRSGYVQADIGRTNAQKIFMTAFIKKFQKSVNVSTVAKVCGQMLKYAETNIGIDEFIYFAKAAMSIDLNSIQMMTLPGSDIRENITSGTWYYVLSRSAMHEVVNKYLNVYTIDIPEQIFDQNYMFTNPDADYMVSIYNSAGNVTVYNGDIIDSEGIVIYRKKPTTSTPVSGGEETTGNGEETVAPDTNEVPDSASSPDETTEPTPDVDVQNPDSLPDGGVVDNESFSGQNDVNNKVPNGDSM